MVFGNARARARLEGLMECVQGGDGLMPATGGSVSLGKAGITFQRIDTVDPELVSCVIRAVIRDLEHVASHSRVAACRRWTL